MLIFVFNICLSYQIIQQAQESHLLCSLVSQVLYFRTNISPMNITPQYSPTHYIKLHSSNSQSFSTIYHNFNSSKTTAFGLCLPPPHLLIQPSQRLGITLHFYPAPWHSASCTRLQPRTLKSVFHFQMHQIVHL